MLAHGCKRLWVLGRWPGNGLQFMHASDLVAEVRMKDGWARDWPLLTVAARSQPSTKCCIAQ